MGKSHVFRTYPMPLGTYNEMRELAESKGIAVSKVMDAAFDWWLSKVSSEKGYYAGFVARLPRYVKAWKTSQVERVPLRLKVGNATLLDVFSKNLNVNKAALMYAIFEEYHSYSIEEIVFAPQPEKPAVEVEVAEPKPTPVKPLEQKPKPVEQKPIEAKLPEQKPAAKPPEAKTDFEKLLEEIKREKLRREYGRRLFSWLY